MRRLLIPLIAIIYIIHIAAADFSYSSPDFVPEDFIIYSSGGVNSTGIRITEQNNGFSSMIFHKQPLALGTGFRTDFVINITNCDSFYGGADGFTFVLLPQLPPLDAYVPGGSALGAAALSNAAVVGFILGSDVLAMCAVNSASNFGGSASLRDDLTHCQIDSSKPNVMRDLRCSGVQTIKVEFTLPATWEVTVDFEQVYTFEKNVTEILDWNYIGYVGFTGGIASGYMNQYIVDWSILTPSNCVGPCIPTADCTIQQDSSILCACPEDTTLTLDGSYCAPPVTTANVVPILECFQQYGDGNYEAFYGYESSEPTPVFIPAGEFNEFVGLTATDNPLTFHPGRTPFYPQYAFSIFFNSADLQTVTWNLAGFTVSFDITDTSKRCPTDLLFSLQFKTSRQLDTTETQLLVGSISNNAGISSSRISVTSANYSPAKKRANELAELEIEVAGTDPNTSGEKEAAEVVQNFIEAAKNETLMNEVVNPDQMNPDPNREFVDVKPLPTGVETNGQLINPPSSPQAEPQTTFAPSSGSKIVFARQIFVVLCGLFFFM